MSATPSKNNPTARPGSAPHKAADTAGRDWRKVAGPDESPVEGTPVELLSAHYDRLMGYVTYRLKRHIQGRVSPEDVVQEICILAVRFHAKFKSQGSGSYERWLITIARHHISEVIRYHLADIRDIRNEAKQASGLSGESDAFGPVLVAKGRGPFTSVARREALADLTRAIGTLKPSHRRVIHMRFSEGYSFAQIAQAMGQSVGSVQMICLRAMEELRKKMDALDQR